MASITLPATFNELQVVVNMGDYLYAFSFYLCKATMVNNQVYRQGFFVASSDMARAHFKYTSSDNKITMTDAQVASINTPYTLQIAYR